MYLLYYYQTTLFDNKYLRYSLKGQPYPSPNIIFFAFLTSDLNSSSNFGLGGIFHEKIASPHSEIAKNRQN